MYAYIADFLVILNLELSSISLMVLMINVCNLSVTIFLSRIAQLDTIKMASISHQIYEINLEIR